MRTLSSHCKEVRSGAAQSDRVLVTVCLCKTFEKGGGHLEDPAASTQTVGGSDLVSVFPGQREPALPDPVLGDFTNLLKLPAKLLHTGRKEVAPLKKKHVRQIPGCPRGPVAVRGLMENLSQEQDSSASVLSRHPQLPCSSPGRPQWPASV